MILVIYIDKKQRGGLSNPTEIDCFYSKSIMPVNRYVSSESCSV